MKRIFFLFLVLGVFALGVNAQLVVDYVGRVLVGEGNASSQLSVYAKESKQKNNRNQCLHSFFRACRILPIL